VPEPIWILLKQETVNGTLAVASAGPYTNLHLTPDTPASTPPISFYRLDALPATQPTTSKHWRQKAQDIYMHQKVLS